MSRRLAAGVSVLLLAVAHSPAPASAGPATPDPVGSSATPTEASPGAGSPTPVQPSSSRSYSQDESGFGLLVSPTRLTISGDDIGTTQQITVANRSAETVPVTVQKRNFVPNADGSLRYDDDAPWAASEWVTLSPERFDLAPGTEQIVTADVSLPAEPDVGDHQVAVIFLVPAGEGQGNVKINRGIGLPAFITVPGPVDDSVTLRDLRAPRFVAWGPVEVNATVQNLGTVHRDFRGPDALAIEAIGTDGQFADFTVARGATREITGSWEPPLLCVCRLSATVTNDNGASHTETVRVVVFPWPIALAVLGALLVGLLLVRQGRRSFETRVAAAAAQRTGSDTGGNERGPLA